MSEYIQNLNPTQRDAAVNYQGASLIIAGAGSGKTRVLTCRIAYMLSQGVQAHTVLALTFTNKAAKEMRERIATLVPGGMSRSLWMGTFHSVFARILRAESDKLGYPSSFTIYDSADAKNLVKLAIKELNLSDETYKPNVVAARISKAKNNLVTPQAYEANSSLQAEDREQRIPQFLDIYKLYARKCRENGAMDFDDLLLNTNILMRDFPEVLTKYQNQFRYILVDEYQDTNFAQYVIIRRLGELHGNVCVVGDDAQSIYSFRGAKIENILRFQQDFPGAKLFKLEQNYRSTQTIVNAANCVIEKNQRQIRKKSFSAADEGDPIRVIKAYTDKEESALLASDIYTTVRTRGVQYSDVAVLYRTNAQSRALEEALRSRNIPYKIYGGMSFYQRKEIKDMLAYVRLVVNPRDDEALRRIINYPRARHRRRDDRPHRRRGSRKRPEHVGSGQHARPRRDRPRRGRRKQGRAVRQNDRRAVRNAFHDRSLHARPGDRDAFGPDRHLQDAADARVDQRAGEHRGAAQLDPRLYRRAGADGRRHRDRRGIRPAGAGPDRRVAAKRRAAHGHGQREPRRVQQSDADDRPLGQGARIRIQGGFGGRGSGGSFGGRSADGQSGPASALRPRSGSAGRASAGRPDPPLSRRRVLDCGAGVRQAVDGACRDVDARQRRLHRGPAASNTFQI